jgi:hypothetical protein
MPATTQSTATSPVTAVRAPARATAPTRRASSSTPLPTFIPSSAPALRLAGGAPHGRPALTLSGPGEPLPQAVRERLEPGFGADLGAVRVHQGDAAARLALDRGARAFAYGHHIVLGEGASPHDLGLMAHEIAHVLQQRGAPAVQRCSGGVCTCGGACGSGSRYEQEAARASESVSAGGTFVVTGQTSSAIPQHAPEEEGWLEGKIWGLLEEFAPNLVPIIRRGPEGVLDWIKDKVTGAIRSFVDTVMAPVRTIATTGRWLQGQFAPLLAWMQDAAAKIAQNDCKPITEAAQKIEDLAAKIITPVVEKLQEVAGKVGDFLKGVWDKFGAPVWEFIKKYAGQQWEQLQQLGEWIWDKAAPVRKLAARAWTWLKNKIGIGEGPEGQNGILQWIQGKAGAAWDWVQAKLEPYKKQITTVATVVGGIALLISPAGPVLLAGAAIVGVVQGVRWIRANLAGGNAIVRARTYAQTVLIPQIMGAIGKMTGAVTRMASSVSGKLGEFSAGLGRVVGAAASTALNFLVDAAQWLADKAVELAAWATEKLTALADWIQKGLERLRAFLQPVMDFLAKVGNLLLDIYGLPLLLAGALWNKIPRCIRDPFVDWIVPLILRQIDIFKELVKDNEAWQKTKADVMNIIRLVFVTKDLLGAVRATFHLILRVFNVPVELLMKVVQKAAVAWDTVIAAPIKFLKNCVRTVGRGLQIYWSHLKDNLLFGLEGWLFGELAEKGISKPKSWTDPWDLMQLALDVMGLSMNHVFDLMEQRFEKTTVDKLRVWYGRLSRVWNWIMEMRGKKPAEVTKEIISGAKDFAKSILEGIVTWIVEKVSAELATMAAAAAASAGLSEVLDAVRRIYRAIKTAVRWMRTILEMVNSTLDSVLNIAAGAIEPAAVILESALKRATPAVIGFLGDQVGLGGIADKIREIIDKLRAKVDAAILAIIDKLRSFFSAIAQGAKDVVGAFFQWWKAKLALKGADGKPHSVYFSGGGSDAEPIFASDPMPVEKFIDSIAGEAENKQQPRAGYIKQVRDLLKDIKNAQKRFDKATDDAAKDKAAKEIDKAFRAMGTPLEQLAGGSAFATETNPLPIDYPKRRWSLYPTIYIGPLAEKRVPQSKLANRDIAGVRTLLTAAEEKAWSLQGFAIREYRPTQAGSLPNGNGPLGIAQAYRTEPGLKIELKPGNTEGGGKINKVVRPYGYRAKEEDSAESRDGDHLVEMQLGGPNILANLWPLDASENRSGGSTTASMKVPLPAGGQIEMGELKKRALSGTRTWLIIKRTL